MKRISGNADDIKDKKDRVKKDGYNRGQHCIYCLTYHMIFVTHYRKPVINEEMSSAMKEFSNHMAEQFRGKIPVSYTHLVYFELFKASSARDKTRYIEESKQKAAQKTA